MLQHGAFSQFTFRTLLGRCAGGRLPGVAVCASRDDHTGAAGFGFSTGSILPGVALSTAFGYLTGVAGLGFSTGGVSPIVPKGNSALLRDSANVAGWG